MEWKEYWDKVEGIKLMKSCCLQLFLQGQDREIAYCNFLFVFASPDARPYAGRNTIRIRQGIGIAISLANSSLIYASFD